jgi:hypothetical protein
MIRVSGLCLWLVGVVANLRYLTMGSNVCRFLIRGGFVSKSEGQTVVFVAYL